MRLVCVVCVSLFVCICECVWIAYVCGTYVCVVRVGLHGMCKCVWYVCDIRVYVCGIQTLLGELVDGRI